METAYIGMGSNIEPEKNIIEALDLLSKDVNITGISTFYKTEPVDRPDQLLYYNGVVKIETHYSPTDLKLLILRMIEEKLGRKRTGDKSASRPIDLDILVFGRLSVHDKDLDIPDPHILKRPFLAIPLFELDNEMSFPEWRLTIGQIAENLKENDMKPLLGYTKKLRRILSNGH